MDSEGFSQVLSAVYETTESFDRWGHVLSLMQRAFDCHAVSLIERDARSGASRFAEVGLGPSVAQDYFRNWHERNVFYGKGLMWRTGAAQLDREVLTRDELLRSDYYNQFLKRYDMRGFIGLTIANDSVQRRGISLLRPPPRDDFDDDSLKWARALMPHMQNVVRIERRLADARLESSASSALLELNPTGVVLLEATGRVVFANRAARAIAAANDGFTLRGSKFEALRPSENVALQALVAAALGRPAQVQSPRGGAMRISRTSGAQDYILTVGPAPVASKRFAGSGAAAFAMIVDPTTRSRSMRAVLARVYGLTATETRVAHGLANGETLEETAASLAMKTSTAKWHLHSLFQKTGVARQSELVRLLLSLPWAGGDSS